MKATPNAVAIVEHVVRLNSLEVGYRELGSGPAVLLIHGWPTSSILWRNVMPAIAEQSRVVAIDLPGFGLSAKPRVRYDFAFHENALEGLLDKLEIGRVGLAVHDLGGPVGVHWALRNRDRVDKLALTNTLLYPEFSAAVQEFVTACATPTLRKRLTSPEGLEELMLRGVTRPATLTHELLAAVLDSAQSMEARTALARAGIGLELEGFETIARELPSLDLPVRIVYGAKDRILPDVGETMARVARDVPHAEVTVLPDCGHFLQEEAPDELGPLLAEFFAAGPRLERR